MKDKNTSTLRSYSITFISLIIQYNIQSVLWFDDEEVSAAVGGQNENMFYILL